MYETSLLLLVYVLCFAVIEMSSVITGMLVLTLCKSVVSYSNNDDGSSDNLCNCQTIEESLGGATTLSAPQDQVEALIRQVAAESDLEITDKLVDLEPGQSTLAPGASVRSEEHEKEDQLARRSVLCHAVISTQLFEIQMNLIRKASL